MVLYMYVSSCLDAFTVQQQSASEEPTASLGAISELCPVVASIPVYLIHSMTMIGSAV